jgi:thiol-disulfide isomerase/thioredoxin
MRIVFASVAAVLLSVSFAASDAAPFQAARTITGQPFNPSGQVTVVHYWATWCAPCRLEMPILDAFYRKHHGQGLAMLAVSEEGHSERPARHPRLRSVWQASVCDEGRRPNHHRCGHTRTGRLAPPCVALEVKQ